MSVATGPRARIDSRTHFPNPAVIPLLHRVRTMPTDLSSLTKGQIRKLNALRRSIGDALANDAFAKWLKQQTKATKAPKEDVVAKKIAEALKPYQNDKSFNLGRYGYKVTRSKGRGVKGGFAVTRITG